MYQWLAAVNPADTGRILLACALLMGALIVLFLVVWYYRKHFLLHEDSPGGFAWTFEDLRRMRESGQLTEQEYQSLRASLLGLFRGGEPIPPVASKPPGGSSDSGADFDLEKGERG